MVAACATVHTPCRLSNCGAAPCLPQILKEMLEIIKSMRGKGLKATAEQRRREGTQQPSPGSFAVHSTRHGEAVTSWFHLPGEEGWNNITDS